MDLNDFTVENICLPAVCKTMLLSLLFCRLMDVLSFTMYFHFSLFLQLSHKLFIIFFLFYFMNI